MKTFLISVGLGLGLVAAAGIGPAAVMLIRSETLSLAQTITVK